MTTIAALSFRANDDYANGGKVRRSCVACPHPIRQRRILVISQSYTNIEEELTI